MLQVTNLRFLRCSPNYLSFLSHLKKTPKITLSNSLCSVATVSPVFTVFASSSRRPRNVKITRRGNHSLRESPIKEREDKERMEVAESVGFNKRRAEGSDKNEKHKNLQLKCRRINPISTLCYVQILGTGMDTQDTSPSVLLFFDNQRLIFNAGEGLQRFCTEHKVKLSKLDHIFLSRVCSETAGGLPGLLLTLAGIGEIGMSVNIWGPSDLNYLVHAMSFIPKAAMVHTRSFGSLDGHDGVFVPNQKKFTDPIVLIKDEVVKISAILVKPSDGSYSNENSKMDPVERVKPSDISVIYACELPEIKGKFDPEKAKSLGLKPGPKFRELQLGKSVRSDHKNITVHSSDVLGPSFPGPIVLLVDCPTMSHMQELVSIQSLNSYYADSSGSVPECHKMVNCVIHLTPMPIANTPDYLKWMKRFSGAQHIMAGHKMDKAGAPILKSSVRIATRLNYLCPQFFPATGFCYLQQSNYFTQDCIVPSEGTVSEISSVSAENLLKFHLRPYTHLGLDRSSVPGLTTSSELINELLSENPEIMDASDQLSQFWPGSKETDDVIPGKETGNDIEEESWLNGNTVPSCLESISRKDMEIVLLGTGSSQPSKYRNVASIFINVFSKGSLILDCGEGTLAQLRRRFGIEGADDAVRALRLIWISHIHADHHTGLTRILALRSNLLKDTHHEPLLVIGPAPLKKFLEAYQQLEDLDMQFLDCRQTTEASLASFESDYPDNETEGSPRLSRCNRLGNPIGAAVYPILKKLKRVLGDAGLEALISFPVVHCPQAFGVVLKASERINSAGKEIPGWKLVYSGDTRPCPELVEASRGATVLIHEATFEDGLEEEAIQRNHSTTKEAIEVGTSAGAYRTILTHFSQRYPKVPVFDGRYMGETCIAFDLMSVNMADLPVLPRVLPFLKLLFKNELEADELDDDASAAAL